MEETCNCSASWSPGQKSCTQCGRSRPQPRPPGLLARMKQFRKDHPLIALLIAVLGIGVVVLVLISSEPTEGPVGQSSESVKSVREVRTALLANIEGYPEVIDAAITQDGNQLSLVLVVAMRTGQSRAKELGDNFVRMAKSLMSDGGVGREIGRGKYHYLIGVYYPTEQLVARGGKAASSEGISW